MLRFVLPGMVADGFSAYCALIYRHPEVLLDGPIGNRLAGNAEAHRLHSCASHLVRFVSVPINSFVDDGFNRAIIE
jgi:hypothetical protein